MLVSAPPSPACTHHQPATSQLTCNQVGVKDGQHQRSEMPVVWEASARGCLWGLPMSGDSPEAACVVMQPVRMKSCGAQRLGSRPEGSGRERGCLCQLKQSFIPGPNSPAKQKTSQLLHQFPDSTRPLVTPSKPLPAPF